MALDNTRIESNVPEAFFRWRSVPYRFISEEAAERFSAATQRKSGPIILWDLVNALHSLGYDLQDLKARSIYDPDMLREPLRRYENGGLMGGYDRKAFGRSFDRVRRMFLVKGDKLRPIALDKCIFEGDKNSGAPYFQKKADVHSLALKEAYAIRRGMAPPPLTVFHRGKNEEEARPVFGYPFALTLLESRFFHPYQDAILNSQSSPYVGGKEDAVLAGLINELRHYARWIVEIDYSGLDGSASGFLISKAFQIIRSNFEMTDFDARDWDIIERYHIFAPILAPDGRMYYGKEHGVASGSMFTQLVDTIICCLAFFYVKETLGVDCYRYYGYGDDSIIGINGERPNLDEWKSKMGELGLVLNLVKSKVKLDTDKPYFLGHYWEQLRATRDIEETLTRLVTPERNRQEFWSKEENNLTYRDALIERITAYQEDNPDAFNLLQRLIQLIKFPELDKKPWYLATSDILTYRPIKEQIERQRWRKTKHSARESPPGHFRTINDWY